MPLETHPEVARCAEAGEATTRVKTFKHLPQSGKPMVSWSPRNTVIAAILLSALFGGVTGLAVNYLSHPGPTAQTRDFYLFGVDQSFNKTLAVGLRGDYAFSSSVITVNKGDTLVV